MQFAVARQRKQVLLFHNYQTTSSSNFLASVLWFQLTVFLRDGRSNCTSECLTDGSAIKDNREKLLNYWDSQQQQRLCLALELNLVKAGRDCRQMLSGRAEPHLPLSVALAGVFTLTCDNSDPDKTAPAGVPAQPQALGTCLAERNHPSFGKRVGRAVPTAHRRAMGTSGPR